MKIRGKVLKIETNASMYECTVLTEFENGLGKMNCYLVSDSQINFENPEYVEAYVEDREPIIIRIGNEYDFNLSACFVCSYERIDSLEKSIFQSRPTICSIIFEGKVIEIIDDDGDFICWLKDFDEMLLVEYESKIDDVQIGSYIRFSGELKIVLAEPKPFS